MESKRRFSLNRIARSRLDDRYEEQLQRTERSREIEGAFIAVAFFDERFTFRVCLWFIRFRIAFCGAPIEFIRISRPIRNWQPCRYAADLNGTASFDRTSYISVCSTSRYVIDTPSFHYFQHCMSSVNAWVAAFLRSHRWDDIIDCWIELATFK